MPATENFRTTQQSAAAVARAAVLKPTSHPRPKRGDGSTITILLGAERMGDELTKFEPTSLRDVSLRFFFALDDFEKRLADTPASKIGIRSQPTQKIDSQECLSSAREATRVGTDFAFYAPVMQELDVQRKQWAVQLANISEEFLKLIKRHVDDEAKITKDHADFISGAITETKNALRALTTNFCLTAAEEKVKSS